MSSILLTGATGFIGSALLRRLIAQGGITPYLLVRAENAEVARKRLAQKRIPVSAIANDRLLLGDITQPDCGLDDPTLALLRGKVTTIIHCAARPCFEECAPGELEAVNTVGTRHVAELARALNTEHMIHLSTLYVCGKSPHVFTESDGDLGQLFRNRYEASKLAAEQCARGILTGSATTLSILRPGIVTTSPRDLHAGLPDNIRSFIAYYWHAARRHRATGAHFEVPLNPEDAIRFVPVDYLVDFIIALLGDASTHGGCFHIQTPHALTWAQINAWMKHDLGVDCVQLTGRPEGSFTMPDPFNRFGPYLWQSPEIDDAEGRCFAQRHRLSCAPITRPMVESYMRTFIEDREVLKCSRLALRASGGFVRSHATEQALTA